MFETLFGTEMPLAMRFFIAFLVVLGLIGLTAWVVRRFGSDRLGNAGARGRQPRLAVIDAATIDGRRRLVIIRRDNVEHLLMIGGTTDLVVETNIVRSAAAAPRDAGRGATSDTLPRAVPLGESVWPLQPQSEPVRSQRADDQWSEPTLPMPAPAPAPAPAARPSPRSIDTLAGLAAELSSREAETAGHRPPPLPEPVAVRVGSPAAAAPHGDQNLTEMAQRLEASLRRPAGAAPRPAEPQARDATAGSAPAPEPRPGPTRGGYESLEQEMASLLGRPKANKT